MFCSAELLTYVTKSSCNVHYLGYSYFSMRSDGEGYNGNDVTDREPEL